MAGPPPPNALPVTIVELDQRRTVLSASAWHARCAELRGMRLCQHFSVLGHRLFKREHVAPDEEEKDDSKHKDER